MVLIQSRLCITNYMWYSGIIMSAGSDTDAWQQFTNLTRGPLALWPILPCKRGEEGAVEKLSLITRNNIFLKITKYYSTIKMSSGVKLCGCHSDVCLIKRVVFIPAANLIMRLAHYETKDGSFPSPPRFSISFSRVELLVQSLPPSHAKSTFKDINAVRGTAWENGIS